MSLNTFGSISEILNIDYFVFHGQYTKMTDTYQSTVLYV